MRSSPISKVISPEESLKISYIKALNSLESISSINVLWPALEACRSFKFFTSPSLGLWYELNTVLMSLLRTRCVTNVPMNLRLFNIIALSTFICTLYLSFKASAIKAKKKSRNSNDFSILEKNFGLTAISIASAGLSDLSLVMRGSEILIDLGSTAKTSFVAQAVITVLRVLQAFTIRPLFVAWTMRNLDNISDPFAPSDLLSFFDVVGATSCPDI
uniref:Uncharacterized protein n=1 Tax=Glossina palpalis gambiensis TaxID=67801 RepID=A0A1B0BL97_9MUSC